MFAFIAAALVEEDDTRRAVLTIGMPVMRSRFVGWITSGTEASDVVFVDFILHRQKLG